MHTHTYTQHLVSPQNCLPNFYIRTRQSSRPQAEALRHAWWTAQLSAVAAGHPQPPPHRGCSASCLQQDHQPLSYLPSSSSPPHHTEHAARSSSQRCPPHTENRGTRVSANSSGDRASKAEPPQETFSWASPEQRINLKRAAASRWQRQDDDSWVPASSRSFPSSISSTSHTQCACTPARWVPFKSRSHLRG